MKKVLIILVVVALLFGAACAETIDIENLTIEELVELNQRTEDALRDRILEKTRDDRQVTTTEDGLVMADNGEEVMVRSYQGTNPEVIIPAEYNGLPVTRIGEKAFYDNDLITSIVLPETVTIVGRLAFAFCGSLRSINLENVSEFEDSVFHSTKLTGVLILKAAEVSIGREAFRGCNFSGIKIYSDNVRLDGYTFVEMKELQYIFFNRDAVITTTSKNLHVFGYDDKLETVVLPDKVTFAAEDEFGGCPNVCIYSPANSYAAAYAKQHFLVCNTDEYENMCAFFETSD